MAAGGLADERCLHCGHHISRPCGNAGGWYCDECFLWWAIHATYWRLWSVAQTRHGGNLAARVCQDADLGLLVCSFLAPSSALVVCAGARDVSLSAAAGRRGQQLGLNACSSVLIRMATEFVHDPEYLYAKGFAIVACGTLSHVVTLPELSPQVTRRGIDQVRVGPG